MRYGILLIAITSLAGCPGSDGGVGATCGGHGDCDGTLQCSAGVCVPRCARAPECGDGYACSSDGICTLANGQPGDGCASEVDCSPGLSCQIDGNTVGADNFLLASCTAQRDGKPAGSECDGEGDDAVNVCRNGTCALGHCVDLCSVTRDCAAGYSCMDIPRIEVNGGSSLFRGCLPSSGNVSWPIRVSAPTNTILFPVPSAARYAQLVFSIDDSSQRVGARSLVSPSGQLLYTRPCESGPSCDAAAEYFGNIVRHRLDFGQSVLAFPSTPSAPLETGSYRVQVSSFRRGDSPGTAIPSITAVVRIDTATLLDLRFHFLDLDEHVCQSEMGGTKFDATQAQGAPFFQEDFIGQLRTIFSHGGIALGTLSYDDIRARPDLDELDVNNAGSLLSLGTGETGIDVFFVRALSPVGLQAFGPNPGPAGVTHTRQSGIVIGLDTLCYRSWTQLARLTAYEIARYMGLSHNVELETDSQGRPYQDHIEDGNTADENLMFYSEFGGTDISPGQRDILVRSGVLR